MPFAMGMLSMDDMGLDDEDLSSLRNHFREESDIEEFVPPPGKRPWDDLEDSDELPVAAPIKEKKRKKKKRKKKSKPAIRDQSELRIMNVGKACPSCNIDLDDDAQVCVSCGYDYAVGKKVASGPSGSVSPRQKEALQSANQFLGNLEKLSWISLTPIGVLLGPFVLLRSLAAEGYAAGLRDKASKTFKSSLTQVRFVALIATILWGGLSVYGFSVYKTEKKAVVKREQEFSKAEIKDLARAVRARIKIFQRFPSKPGLSASRALEELKASGSLKGGLHEDDFFNLYDARFPKQLDKTTPETRWLFWHRYPQGPKDQIQVVTLGGSVEVYEPGDFQLALKAAFESKDETPGNKPEVTLTDAQALAKFRDLIKELPKTLSTEDFRKKVGREPLDMLTTLAKSDDDALKAGVIDVLVIIFGLKPDDQKRLLRQLEFRASDAIILKLIGIYQEKKDPHWLDMCARFYKETDDEDLREEFRADIHAYCKEDAQLRQVLESAVRLRRSKEEDALYAFPAEFYPRFRLFLFDKKLGPEVEAIYHADEAAALPELEKLLIDEQEQARLKALELLVTFPFLTKEDEVLTKIAEALQNRNETYEFRRAALKGMERFNNPKIVAIATEQLGFAEGKLSNEVLKIFARSARSDVLVPPLLLALDGPAAKLALRVLRPRLDNKMVSLLDEKARRIKSPDGILNALKLLEKRIGKDVWKIMTVFAKEKNILVRKGILRHIQTTQNNPLDKNQAKFVTDFAVQLLKSKDRDPDLKIKACSLLGIYQNNSTLKALSRFASQDKASDRARRSAIKTISDFANTKALSALVALERSKRLPLSMKNYAGQVLRTMTSGNGKPTWQTWIAKNRAIVDQRFKDAERRRENRLAELETRARRALEAQK